MGEVRPDVPTILIPLYIYPLPGAWERLYTAISQHPKLNFIIVINPASGPGSSSSPDKNYMHEIPQLNAYPNVQTVGYVAAGYATRSLDEVFKDIDTYATWRDNSSVPGLGMSGIFLDETPNHYHNTSFEFLNAIDRKVRCTEGLGRHGMIIHNPGTIPDPRYLDSPDITVVFEGTYKTWLSNFSSKALPGSPIDRLISVSKRVGMERLGRINLACIVHSVPMEIARTEMRQLVGQLCRCGRNSFMTDMSENYYAAFGETWAEFVAETNKMR